MPVLQTFAGKPRCNLKNDFAYHSLELPLRYGGNVPSVPNFQQQQIVRLSVANLSTMTHLSYRDTMKETKPKERNRAIVRLRQNVKQAQMTDRA
jgi:hypothetical protein